MRPLLVMTLADLRQRVRDRTVLIFGLLVPLGLIVVFHAVVGGVIDQKLEPVRVAISTPHEDTLAGALVQVVRSLDSPVVRLQEATAAEVRRTARDGGADLAIVVPAGFTRAVEAGRPATVRVVDASASLETQIVETVVTSALDRMHAAAVAARAAGTSGLDRQQIEQVIGRVTSDDPAMTVSAGRAANEQLPASGSLVAGQAGLFLLFTVGFGVLALLAEKDQGTLPRLYSMPVRRSAVVMAKGASAFILGIGATSVLLAAGSWLFGVDFGAVPAIGVVVVCAVAAATSLTFVVARLARTAEQASLVQAILAMLLGVAGGAFFPLAVRGWVSNVLDLNPVAAFQRGLGITAGGGGVTDLGAPVLTLLGFAAAMILLSRVLPDRSAR